MNTFDIQILAQAIEKHLEAKPEDRTFKLQLDQGQTLWVKTPSTPRLRLLYTVTNRLMVWLNMPYFQAPPHKGAPGGCASLAIEAHMLKRLKTAQVPVPEVVASTNSWLALTATGEFNLDIELKNLPITQRLPLWQQAITAIADVHTKNCCLSQCFARNIMLEKRHSTPKGNATPPYCFYFLDFEEDPTQIMTLADAQARDWAMFLHSTAVLIRENTEQAQELMINLLKEETLETQLSIQRIFKKLKPLKYFKSMQWLGRDSIRIYQLGVFAEGIHKKLQQKK
ncbi:MAG: hypothetical protein ACRCWR_00485 [Saezia sp.]